MAPKTATKTATKSAARPAAKSSAPAAQEMQPVQHEPIAPEIVAQQSSAQHLPPQDLTWAGLSYSVKLDDGTWKKLVDDVSGTARAGRVVAVMGPSGAGKTTLMNTIAGRIPIVDGKTEVEGTAYLNNTVLRTKYKPVISYVAQDDIVMGKDTPREALYFSHRVRYGATHEEAEEAVNDALRRLRMEKCADTLIGVPGLIKGVSGGEKKRANIGSELINNPQILFLDEPTTGLDSVTALRVGELLRQLAGDEQRTVLTTIHTPSSDLFECFDDILLLSHGRVVYHGPREEGPAYFGKIGHPVPARVNPSEHYMKVLQLPAEETAELAKKFREHVAADKKNANKSQNRTPMLSEVSMHDEALEAYVAHEPAGCMTEMWLLTKRSMRNTYRDPAGTFGRVGQALVFAIIFGLFYLQMDENDAGVQDRRGLLFLTVINMCFMSVLAYVTVFPVERAVFLQEMTNDAYSAWAYYFSKVLADLPMSIVIPIVYSTIIYWMTGLAQSFTPYIENMLVMLLLAQCAGSVGMLIATVFAKVEVAMTVVPLILMPLIIVAGLFANTDRLEPYWIWLTYISFPRYGYKGVMDIEFSHLKTIGGAQYKTGDDVLRFDGFTDTFDEWWVQCILLTGMTVIFRVLGGFSLWLQGRWQRSSMAFERNFKKMKRHAEGAPSPLSGEEDDEY